MPIHIKFRVLNTIIALFFCLSLFTSYEISKGTFLVELNYKHIKYNNIFFDNVLKYERTNATETQILNTLKTDIEHIKKQPIDCLNAVTPLERAFMTIIDTHGAINLCIKDIDDANRALASLNAYNAGKIDKQTFTQNLNKAIADFRENSEKFEPLITKTVDALFNTLIVLSILFAACVFILVNIITRAIKRDYNKMESMSKSIQKLASFPEKNPHPVIEVNHKLQATYANPSFKKHFPHVSLDNDFTQSIAPNILTLIKKTLKEKKSQSFEQKVDTRWFSFDVDYIEFDDEAFVRIFGHDITSIKDAEQELTELNAELEEFAYRTSHDLRSPIISSIALLDISQTMIKEGNTDKAAEGMTHAHASLSKLKQLIDDILQLTMVRNKEETHEEIDVSKTIEDSINKLSNMEGFSKLSIHREYEFNATLTTKPLRLTMIIENLLSNAIKYQDPKSDAPHIEIKTKTEDQSFVLEIADNGLGIPKEQQESLFKMFKRFHPKTSFGSGLGLYLTKKSVDTLGAHIEFKSLTKGVSFTLKIPLQ